MDVRENEFVVAALSQSGRVSTLAGSGRAEHKDGEGFGSSFNECVGVALSADGTIVTVDMKSSCIRQITPKGEVSTLAGGGSIVLKNAAFATVVRDIGGRAFTSGLNLRDAQGKLAVFNYPRGIAVDKAGIVWVADTKNNCIRKIDENGLVSTPIGTGYAGCQNGFISEATFHGPVGVVIAPNGAMFVSDTQNHCIRRIWNQEVTTFAGSGKAGCRDGEYYEATLNEPTGLALDNEGNLLVVQPLNHRIRRISPRGVVSTLAGNQKGYEEGRGTAASFNCPSGIAVSSFGVILVTDSGNNCVRLINSQGDTCTLAGGEKGFQDGQGRNAYFHSLHGVAAFDSSTFVVTDNNRIRLVKLPASEVLCSLASQQTLGDNAEANYIRFHLPMPEQQELKGAEVDMRAQVEEEVKAENIQCSERELEVESLDYLSQPLQFDIQQAQMGKQISSKDGWNYENDRKEQLGRDDESKSLVQKAADKRGTHGLLSKSLREEADIQIRDWVALRAKFPQFEGCGSLQHLRALRAAELEELLRVVPVAERGQFRCLYQGDCSRAPCVSEETKDGVIRASIPFEHFSEDLIATLSESPPSVAMIKKLKSKMEAEPLISATRAMTKDLIYLISPPGIATTSLSCQCNSSTILFRTFVQMYQQMLAEAENAYRILQTMSFNHQEGRFEAARSLFGSARNTCLRVATVVQHITNCKFDVSKFKCYNHSCSQAAHTSAHVIVTLYQGDDQPNYNKVPRAFEGLEWNAKVAFSAFPLDKGNNEEYSHFDYVRASAAQAEHNFHLYMQGVFQAHGKYYPGPLKSQYRCAAKIVDYASNPALYPKKPESMYLKDALRGTLVCGHVDDIRAGLVSLGKALRGVKDRLQENTHDVLANVAYSGLICEVQFHLADFYSLTKFTHGPYEVTRVNDYEELLDAEGNLRLSPFELSES